MLANESCKVTELNIEDNKIPDQNLKMLMGTLHLNEHLKKIRYTVTEKKNKDRRKNFEKRKKQFCEKL